MPFIIDNYKQLSDFELSEKFQCSEASIRGIRHKHGLYRIKLTRMKDHPKSLKAALYEDYFANLMSPARLSEKYKMHSPTVKKIIEEIKGATPLIERVTISRQSAINNPE